MSHKKKPHMKKQSSDAKLDESLGMRRGKEMGMKQNLVDRRKESRGARGK